MAGESKSISKTENTKRLTPDACSDKFERAYDSCIKAIEGKASAIEVQELLAKVARARAVTIEQIGRKIGLLMGRRFQENKTDPEWLLLCSIKRDLSALL